MNNDFSSKTTDKRSSVNNTRFADKISVLHVDDEEAFLKATKIYLEDMGEGKLKVDSLINPEHVFKTLQEKTYDVIVADYRMPSIDGLQLLKLLRDQNVTIPYIILTGRSREEVAIQALNLGANRYIKKGMDTESQFTELIHAIQEEVSHMRTQDALRESEEKLRSFTDSAIDSFLLLDSELNIVDINKAGIEINPLVTRKEDIIGKSILEFLPDQMKSSSFNNYLEVVKTRKSIFIEELVPPKLFGDISLAIKAFKVGDGLGIIASDITERKKTEEELRKSKELYRDLYENAPDMLASVDQRTTTIIRCNQTLATSLGYRKEEIIGKPVLELYHPDCMEDAKKAVQSFEKIGEVHGTELQLKRKDGSKIDVSLNVSVVRDEQGNILYSRSALRDITERKQANIALKESEERLKAFIEAAPDNIQIFDSNLNFIAVNKAVENELGLLKDEILGKHYLEVLPNLKGTERYDKYKEVIRTGKPFFLDGLKVVSRFGDKSFSVRAFKVGTGLGMIISDITERKRAEKALQESEERFRAFFYSTTHAIDIWDSDLNLIDCNQAVLDHFSAEISKETLIGKNITEIIPDIKETGMYDKYIEVLKTGKPYHLESFISNPKFGDKIFSVQAVKVNNGLGMITRDITKHKRAEDVMKARLKLEKLMVHLSSDFINLPLEEMDQIITKALKVIAKFAGAVRSSLFLFSEDLQTVTNTHEWCKNPENSQIAILQNIPSNSFGYYWELLQQKKNIIISFETDLPPEAESEWEWIKEHGWQSLLFVPMVFEGRLYGALGFYGEMDEERQWSDDLVRQLLFVATLITNTLERKKMEREVIKYSKQLEIILDNIPGLIFYKDIENRFIQVNQNLADAYNMTKEEMVGKNLFDLHPNDEAQAYWDDDLEVIKRGKPKLNIEETWNTSEGRSWLNSSKIPFKNAKGEIIGIVGFSTDITKHKQAEEDLLFLNKELQDCASIVAHDLKAPLRNITNLSKWLLRDSVDKLSEEGKDNLNLIVKQTTHMNALIDGIYQYSKIDRIHKKITNINLNKLLSDVIKILSPPENIGITIQTELPVLAVDRTHMIQIFSNLLDNAVKFIDKPKGHITIRCEEKRNYWQFSVADNGPGIEEKHFERIFQMFQTLSTWDESKGTGIGLAIVKKVVQMNGGTVWLESTLKEGSTFFFTLPKG